MSIQLSDFRQVLVPFLCSHCNQRLRLTRYIIHPPTLIAHCHKCNDLFYFQECPRSATRPKSIPYDHKAPMPGTLTPGKDKP